MMPIGTNRPCFAEPSAQAFRDFIKTPAVAAILEWYGFVLPGKEKQ
jgi:hypothetical protein